MKSITLLIFITTFFASNTADAKFYERETRKCPILYKTESWKKEKTIRNEDYFARGEYWFDGTLDIHSGNTIELDPKQKSNSIQSNPKNPAVLVYIGPWQKTTLTKGPFWNQEKTEVEIRMIASQKGQYLENHYEIKDEENAKIPEQKFTPLEEPNDLIVKCDILRAQKWGYDAILEGHINIFRAYLGKSPFATSGKMINAYTKEVLADFGDKENDE